jgi:ATP-dependent Clp protease adaptor protein ClpS
LSVGYDRPWQRAWRFASRLIDFVSAMPIETDEQTQIITETDAEADLDVPWNVIVYDDPVNLMGFVTMILRRIFGYSEEKATALMLEVHNGGKSVVWSGNREKAEFYVQQLQSYQLLAAMKKAA